LEKEKEKENPTQSQEFSYFKKNYKDYPYKWCINGYKGLYQLSPQKGVVDVYACIILLKQE
jgi:hypothetical protein